MKKYSRLSSAAVMIGALRVNASSVIVTNLIEQPHKAVCTKFVSMFRLKPNLKFIHWNQEGWKTGLCSVPPVGQQYSLLTLANNTCIHQNFTELKDRFVKLYKRKVRKSVVR